jgi:hypothetical protein
MSAQIWKISNGHTPRALFWVSTALLATVDPLLGTLFVAAVVASMADAGWLAVGS